MSNVPDVASATPGQQAAAADLLARTEAGTARYSDIAAAKAAATTSMPVWLPQSSSGHICKTR